VISPGFEPVTTEAETNALPRLTIIIDGLCELWLGSLVTSNNGILVYCLLISLSRKQWVEFIYSNFCELSLCLILFGQFNFTIHIMMFIGNYYVQIMQIYEFIIDCYKWINVLYFTYLSLLQKILTSLIRRSLIVVFQVLSALSHQLTGCWNGKYSVLKLFLSNYLFFFSEYFPNPYLVMISFQTQCKISFVNKCAVCLSI